MAPRPSAPPTPGGLDLLGLPAGALGRLLRPDREARVLAEQLDAVRILTEAGVLRAGRPSRLLGAFRELVRWGMTPAAAIAASAVRYPDAAAIVDDAGTVTFAGLHRRTDAIARGLADAGVREGDRVALMARNHRGFIEAVIALCKLGADVVLLNTAFAGPQLTDVCRRERVRAIIHDEEFAHLLREAGRRRHRVLAYQQTDAVGVESLERLAADYEGESLAARARNSRFVILTSGTTGTPKGAARGNPGGLGPAVAILSRIPLRARQTTLIAAPLFHAWGFANFLLSTLLSSTLVLQRRFDPEATLSAASQHRAHAVIAVPVMLQRMLDLSAPVRRARPLPELRVVAVSGSALSGPLALRFMDAYGDVLYNLYGSTEVAWAAIATPRELRLAPGTVGRPPRGTVVKLVDGDGAEVPQGDTGRIFVGSAMVFEGYTGGGDKERIGGLVSTGDLGRLDADGLLFVEGRDDEMIVSGGENVFPAEVESLLGAHPAVADAAVVGVTDEEFGQRLAAFVVCRPGFTLTEDDVRAHVRSSLARYKVPRDVVFLDALPRNPAGKVLKRVLTAGG